MQPGSPPFDLSNSAVQDGQRLEGFKPAAQRTGENDASEQAVLIFQEGRVIAGNAMADERIGIASVLDLSDTEFLQLIHPDDHARWLVTWQAASQQELTPQLCTVRLAEDELPLDLLLNRISYQGLPAIQVIILIPSTRTHALQNGSQNAQRMRILQEIEQATLAGQDEQATARAALKHIASLVPHYAASSVLLIDPKAGEAVLLAMDYKSQSAEWDFRRTFSLDELSVDIQALNAGQPYLVDDISHLSPISRLQHGMLDMGICTYLSVPLLAGGELIGMFNLAADQPGVFDPDYFQVAREIADSLAIAIQQARLRKAELQRRQEAEMMRDVMADLATASDMNQALEIILVNLRSLVSYDRAGLYLLDETRRYALSEGYAQSGLFPPRASLANDPLVSEMHRLGKPLIVADIQGDTRFEHWPDMESVRGWLGAPLISGEEMIGLVSLGSLQPDAYHEADAATVQAFTSQIADVLERAWLQEQSHRRSEELEVLSRLSVALGQAETSENTLRAIIDLVTGVFRAERGVLLFADEAHTHLIARISLDERLVDVEHPMGEDVLWQVFRGGSPYMISEAVKFLSENPSGIYPLLLAEMQSAALIPLKSEGEPFGVLCLAFTEQRWFSLEDVKTYDALAEIVGTALRRAAVLEGLEKQVKLRTQHLSTLYHINAIASEPLELPVILEQVLHITQEALQLDGGAIHLISGRDAVLAAGVNVPESLQERLAVVNLTAGFWQDLLGARKPLIVTQQQPDARLPRWLRRLWGHSGGMLIVTPLRAKGSSLGLMSFYSQERMEFTPDEITLLMTIADQVGSSVERARLIHKAEQAAVIEERQRLARELHDSVTQLIYGQVLFAGASLKVMQQGNQTLLQQHLARLDQAAQQALREMRLLVYELRPSDHLEEGLVNALRRRLEAVERRTGMNAQLSVIGEISLDEATEMALYRIAQEALNNTLKHSAASAVEVSLVTSEKGFRLEIADNGSGFDYPEKLTAGGMGLGSMQDRIEALHGTLEVITSPGNGTRVIAAFEEVK